MLAYVFKFLTQTTHATIISNKMIDYCSLSILVSKISFLKEFTKKMKTKKFSFHQKQQKNNKNNKKNKIKHETNIATNFENHKKNNDVKIWLTNVNWISWNSRVTYHLANDRKKNCENQRQSKFLNDFKINFSLQSVKRQFEQWNTFLLQRAHDKT